MNDIMVTNKKGSGQNFNSMYKEITGSAKGKT